MASAADRRSPLVRGAYTAPMAIEFKKHILDNGLTIIAEVDDAAQTSAAGFFVHTGARDEPREIMGVSHFLEHMMFKGTEDLSAEDINRGFDEIGARNNAYTSHEMTVFYAQVLPERLGRATDLLGRMMRPALRQDDFDTEKEVILEEIAMYADNPFWVLYEAVSERHFGSHAMGYRVLGTPESVRELQRDQMQEYFDQRYSGDNTTVALGGKLDFDRAVEQIEELCGGWSATRPGRDTSRPPISGQRLDSTKDTVNRGYALALADAPAMDDDRRYAAGLLAHLLGGSDNSRLHWALIETGIAEEAQAAFDPHDGTGQYFVYASGDPDRLEEIWSVVEREIAGLGEGISEDDLERVKAKAETSATISGERPGDRMQRLGRLWVSLGEYLSLDDELAALQRVSVQDVRDVFEAFSFSPRTLGTLTPEATLSTGE